MKPRSKIQREVSNLSLRLPGLTVNQEEWAKKVCHEHRGAYRRASRYYCTECGKEFPSNHDITKCTYCGYKWESVTNSRVRNISDDYYFTIITTISGWQVLRHFEIKRKLSPNESPEFNIEECVQEFINSEGVSIIMARSSYMNFNRCSSWNYNTCMSLKNVMNIYNGLKYYIFSYFIYPRMSIIPTLKRNGFSGDFKDVIPHYLLTRLLTNSDVEYSMKTKQYDLLRYLCDKDKMLSKIHKTAIKVCKKNGYVPRLDNKKYGNAYSIYFDYIDLCDYFNLDYRNKKYACPSNIVKAHDTLSAKKHLIEKKKMVEEQEEKYHKEHYHLFGICICSDNIVIRPLTSVAEFVEEGEEMHHCVFSNNYYLKKNTLILSAKDLKGNRIETVEVDLEKFKIIQARGKFNKLSSMHDEIVSLINTNMRLIADAHIKASA